MMKNVNSAAASIFIFLAVLLSISRADIYGIIPHLIQVGLALGITCPAVIGLGGRKALLSALLAIGSFFIILAAWAYGTQPFYPAGHDGYVYHITAIWDLANGWHPFLTPNNNIWVDSYPTGYWALQSYLVSITGLPMAGQALLIGLMAVLGLQAFTFFYVNFSGTWSRFKVWPAILFSAIVVANPILLTQIQTHYVDAPLYTVGASLVLFLISDVVSRGRMAWIGAIACVILLLNIKTSALYFTPLILFSGFLMDLFVQRGPNGIIQRVIHWIGKRGIYYGLAGVFGILVIGYKPYVTNILDHGDLFYPPSAEIMNKNTPMNVQDPMSAPEKFFIGLFARTEHNRYGIPVEAPISLKIPGTFTLAEFKAPDFDTRRGGFGPLFSLALIASFFAFFASRIAVYRQEMTLQQLQSGGIALLGFAMLAVSIFFPEPWWARYVPFLWLTPIFLAITPMVIELKGKCRFFTQITVTITVISLLGCILSATLGAARQHKQTYERFAPLDQMKMAPVVELTLIEEVRKFSDYQSKSQSDAATVYAEILEREGINTKITKVFDEETCLQAGYFFGAVLWCIPKNYEE
ncbi:hypothetical protein [Sneathiella sp. HT1-7]|uniref:hypothetical protein n=1 Tax=Sneathiella sp. HT1-7 TaxID=2887192 RepID=UPI001D14D1F0|nr:hypothetical protein [Sneathiella sp. HT1-7]MCC3304215.1 hypothetical protein [Sneathiella sp. HT1-7]